MKLNKIGIISLVMALALALTGIGYSMWFQTINITGTVNTGHVTLQVSNYTGTFGWKDIDATGDQEDPFDFVQGLGTVTNPALPLDYNDDAPEDHALIGYAAVLSVNGAEPATVDCTAGAINLVLKYWNLFPASDSYFTPDLPDRDWCADFDVANTGSIPIKFVVSGPTYDPTGTKNPPVITVSYTGAAGAITSLEGYQLEPGGSVHVQICVQLPETARQGGGNSFQLTIYGVQWNEYGAPIPGVNG